MKKYYTGIIVVSCLAFICAYSHAADSTADKGLQLSGKVVDGVRVVDVKASRYKYEPDPIVVKLGEKVRVVVTTADVAHGFAVSEFKVNLDVSPGKTETAEFTADKAGEFTEYCTVYCGAGHFNMRGKFIVIK